MKRQVGDPSLLLRSKSHHGTDAISEEAWKLETGVTGVLAALTNEAWSPVPSRPIKQTRINEKMTQLEIEGKKQSPSSVVFPTMPIIGSVPRPWWVLQVVSAR